jgi:retinol-binding protein 3
MRKSLLWTGVLLCAVASTPSPALAQTTQSLEKSEKQVVANRAGEHLATDYIYPDRGRQAQAEIAAALAAGAYDGIDDPTAFAQRLTDDLGTVLHDKHVRVSYRGSAPAGAAMARPPAPPPTHGGFAQVDLLKGNIGYIKLLNFPIPAIFSPAADAAMHDMAGTDALIIDMRDNGGGSAESDSYFGSFFFDPEKPVQLNSIVHRTPSTNEFTTKEYWTIPVASPYLNKPVYILTSRRTFSGGEAFVYDLKARKRAMIYGEITGGGANPGGGTMLNARFGIFIPTGRAENPVTDTNWEGVGVMPDVAMDANLAFQAALRDILSKRAGLAAMKDLLAHETEVAPFVEAHLLNIRTTPLPGGEAAARRNIEDLVRGTPNYALMSKDLAEVTRAQLPRLQADMSKLGPIRSITFKQVAPDGLDVYKVTMANGAIESGIFVSPNGRIETAWIRPADPAARPAASH